MTENENGKVYPSNISIPTDAQRRRQSILMLSESAKSRQSTTSHGRVNWMQGTSPGFGKSMESRALIDVGSPNFKTNSNHQTEIINSLRQNYLKDNISKSNSYTQLSRKSRSSVVVDSDVNTVSDVSIPDYDLNLNSQGGDIVRDLYKLSSDSEPLKKSKNRSFDELDLSLSHRRKDSTASALNVPGGFRREYIVQKIRNDQNKATGIKSRQGSTAVSYGSIVSMEPDETLDIDKVPFLTRNFLEFLYVYGHFAGESFDDDFGFGERTDQQEALLQRRDLEMGSGRRHISSTPPKVKTTTFKSFLLMLKSFIGTGILFLPSAFANGGLLFSFGMLIFFGIYSYWCYYILVRSKVVTGVSSFGDIGLKLYGEWMKYNILTSLTLTQLGFSAAYVVFTSKNLLMFLRNVFQMNSLKIEYLLLMQTIIFIPLSFIRNVSKLSLTSLLANFFTMFGLLIVVFFTAKHLIVDLNMVPEEGIVYGFNSSKWSLFIGTVIFAFEGIGLIIPVQDSMQNPEKFPMVLGLVILTATVLFALVAVLGYLAFGKYIGTVILMNLPQDNLLVNSIQLFYSLAILFSTPLQLFPAIGIIEGRFIPRFKKITSSNNKDHIEYKPNSGKLDWKVKWSKNFLRSLIVLFVISLAYFGSDHLDVFVSFVGCFACIPLVYMYPPMLHLRSYSKVQYESNPNLTNRLLMILDYVLIFFGGIAMIYTSYQVIMG